MEEALNFTAPPRPVAVPAIERELTQLWRSLGEAREAEGPAVMRASVANLVAFAPTPAHGAHAAETLAQVMRIHPCRAILLQVQPDLPGDETRAAVALATQTVGGSQMGCEYIAVSANGEDEDQLPGLTLPLLITDLPTFLWWLGDPPFGSEGFVRLAESADRLVIDSAEFANPLSTFTELAVEVATYGHRTIFSDLNWARLTPWRSLVASLFDSPDWRAHLDQLDTIDVELGGAGAGAPANPITAFLILGWLASRLGWSVEKRAVKLSGGSLGITFRAGRRPIAAQVNFAPAAPPGRLSLLHLRAAWIAAAPSFLVTRAYDSARAETRVTIGEAEPIVRLAHYEHRSEAEQLAEEMEQLGRDRVYEESLQVAETIRGMLHVELFVPGAGG